MNESEKRVLVDSYVAAYNALDVEGMLATVHPEVEFRNVAGGEVDASASGIEALRRLAECSKELFSSRHQEITDFRIEGAIAVATIRFEGVLSADLPNGMKAGDLMRLEGRSEFGFRDGRIDRITDFS
jgi:hypothetical protein